jgi:hypothetical protein
MTPENDKTPTRIAVYLANRARLDAPARGLGPAKGGGPAKDQRLGGKRSKDVKCKPPNKRCGARCIPPNWNCRVSGGGLDSHSRVVAFDPVAGVGGVWRGGKNLKKGIEKGDPELIARGAKGIERGITKLTPGDDLEKKQRFRRNLKTASTITAMALVGFVALRKGHRTLNRTEWYRERFGRPIDQAAYRARERFYQAMDRVPLLRSRHPRPMAPGATGDLISHGLGVQRQAALAQNADPRAATALADRIAGTHPLLSDGVPGIAAVRAVDTRARTEGMGEQAWLEAKAQALYGISRTGGPPGSGYSEPATHELLAEQFGFRLDPQGIRRGGIATEKRTVLRRVQEHITSMHESLAGDMRSRGLDPTRSADRDAFVTQFLGDHPLRMPGVQGAVATEMAQRYERQVRDVLAAADAPARRTMANSLYNSTRSQFDEYFATAYDSVARSGMSGAAQRRGSHTSDALLGLARLHAGNGFGTTPVNKDHANFLNHVYFRAQVQGHRGPINIDGARAQRVAAALRNTEGDSLSPQGAIDYLRANGYPQVHLRGGAPAAAPAPAAPPRATAPRASRPARRRALRTEAQIIAMLMRGGRSRAAAEAEARRIIAQRRTDSPEGDLPPRIAAYLATRARLDAKGKPCGASHIAKRLKCGKGAGAEAPPEGGTPPAPAPSPSKGLGRKVALAAGAAAVIAAVGVTGYLVARDAKRLYKNETLPPPISYRSAVKQGKGGDPKVKHDAALGRYYDSVVAQQGWKPGELVYTALPSNSNPGAPSGAHFAVYMGKSGSMHQFAEIIVDEAKRGESFVSISDVGAGAKRMPPLIYTKAPPLKGEKRPYSPEQISQRIYSQLGGKMRYDKLDNNCESWARMVVSGQPRSTQVDRLSKVTQTLVRGLERATGPRPSAGTPSLAQVAKRLDLYERINAGDRAAEKELKVFEGLLKKGKRTDAVASPLADLPEAGDVLAGATSDADVVLRTKHFLMLIVAAAGGLATPERADAGEKRLGKPCGKSHIARNLKCHNESGTTKALRTAAKVALVAGAVAGGVAIAKQWTKADDDALEEAVRANRLAPEFVKKYEDAAKDPEVAELRAQREADRIKRCGRQDSGKPEAGRSDAYKDCDRQIGSASAYAKVFVRGDAGTVLKVPNPSAGMTKYEVMSAAANEFKHLELVHGAGIDVPRPIRYNPRTGVIEMDYLEGAVSLNDFHKNSTLAPSRRLGIAMDLADSAQSMHRLGIGHYDLHGNNVMVTPEGTPFMLDFGLARSLKHHDMFEAGDAIFNDLHRLPRRILECASDRPAIAATKEINDWLTMRHLPFVYGLQDGKLPEAALAPNIDAYYRDLRKATKYKLTNPHTTLNLKMNL